MTARTSRPDTVRKTLKSTPEVIRELPGLNGQPLNPSAALSVLDVAADRPRVNIHFTIFTYFVLAISLAAKHVKGLSECV